MGSADRSGLEDASVILSLRLRRAGNRRKVASNRVSVDADRSAITVSKELLDSVEFAAIETFDGGLRKWVYARALPSDTLRAGTYRVPTGLIAEVDAQLILFEAQRVELVAKFIYYYPERRAEARDRLRSLFDPRDYPEEHQIRAAFRFHYTWMEGSPTVPDVLQAIDSEMLAREIAKRTEETATEAGEIKHALRRNFAELIAHVTDRLAVDKSRRRRFSDTMIDHLRQFVSTFDARNILSDDELGTLVGRTRRVLADVDTADTLRNDPAVRRRVRQEMTAIKIDVESLEIRPIGVS